MKVMSIVGARPQFIKLAPVSRELRKEHSEVLVHTGQHYDWLMSEAFFKQLGIPQPDCNLGVGSGSHAEQTGMMLVGVEKVLLEELPDFVLVYGDTNSTLAGALAAAKLSIPIGHIEAGLRSSNRQMPEEINRVLTDHVSTLLFCPTETAVRHLAAEGITEGVHNVGDVMCDALLHGMKLAPKSVNILQCLGLEPRHYLLATIHRASNTDNLPNLASILAAFNVLEEVIIFPAHPRVRGVLERMNFRLNSNVRLIEPVGYLEMLALERNARMILTDSGGVQKEAYLCGVPCVTLREETEWRETVEAGWNVIVGVDKDRLVEAVKGFQPKGNRPSVFGDGKASQRITEILREWCHHNR